MNKLSSYLAQSVRSALDDAPCDTVAQVRCAGALEQLRSDTLDLVFLDLGTPGTDVVETLRRLRATGCHGRILIVSPSSYEFMHTLREAADAGLGFQLLRKPPGRDGIRETSAAVLGGW